MSAREPIDYFAFEQDFVDERLRCIPMVVRFKLDACGIKLKLREWSLFSEDERRDLAAMPVDTPEQTTLYRSRLRDLVFRRAGEEPTPLAVDPCPDWSVTAEIPLAMTTSARQLGFAIKLKQWQSISDLQRFALLRLARPGHEHKNFVRALREFGFA